MPSSDSYILMCLMYSKQNNSIQTTTNGGSFKVTKNLRFIYHSIDFRLRLNVYFIRIHKNNKTRKEAKITGNGQKMWKNMIHGMCSTTVDLCVGFHTKAEIRYRAKSLFSTRTHFALVVATKQARKGKRKVLFLWFTM